MNFREMLRMFGGNPKNIILNIVKNSNDPTMNKLIQMIESGDNVGVERYVREYCLNNGIDYDKEFPLFMNNFNR